ncbi:hypothetical protein, partial [Actinocorallia lasiicapitis]
MRSVGTPRNRPSRLQRAGDVVGGVVGGWVGVAETGAGAGTAGAGVVGAGVAGAICGRIDPP